MTQKISTRFVVLSAILILFNIISYSASPAPQFKRILYGASYYLEYMPYERLEQDVRLMEKAGISFVRVGESTWGVMEPEEGKFDFSWLERVLDRLDKARIKVILGTPTYSIPAWLFKKHPEIQVKQINQNRYSYGLRQMTDLTHPTYRFYAERVIRKLVARFRNHPAVIGYQLDNETHPSGTADKPVQRMFREELKKKFGTAEALNKAWGLNYWGQNIRGFDELPPRDGILNPGYKLEWERFQQKIAADFLGWQAKIVNELKRPDQFVSHDFAGIPGDVDPFEIAKALDVPSINIYHGMQDQLTGYEIALMGDFARSLKGGGYLVTETNAQTIGWSSDAQFPPYDGQLRLCAFANIGSGAELVAYWHWHSLHYGQETYWKGVLAHDLEPNRVYAEVSRIAQDLKKAGPELAGLKKKNKAAVLYSLDSNNGLTFMPFDKTVNYWTVLNQFYKMLYKLNVEADFIFPQNPHFEDYSLIIVPTLYIASDDLLGRLAAYVKNGGHVLMSFKSGFCNENSTVRWSLAPGPLREAAGFYYQEFSNLTKPLALRGDPYKAGAENKASVWAEFLIPEKAKPLAYYDHPFFGKYPAATRNAFGQGTLTYEGTYLSDTLQEKIMFETLKLAGISLADSSLPAAVKTKHAAAADGKPLHFYYNFSDKRQTFVYYSESGVDILTGRAIGQNQKIDLAHWNLLIVKVK
ncbi:MAG: beta-galactosidase [Candidatus Aminicenantes bacterium]|nr:beta-galactosidase [Candidatus Aminicenantes bacterium]